MVELKIVEPKKDEVFRFSYSMLSAYINCRKYVKYMYVNGLKPKGKTQRKLDQGTLFHLSLETWYKYKSKDKVFEVIKQFRENNDTEVGIDISLHVQAMFEGYLNKYANDNELEIVALEQEFSHPIHDIKTKKIIPNVEMYGRIDGIVCYKGKYYILENKTAASLNYGYIEKLWGDLQIQLYSYYAAKSLQFECSGVLYNVCIKSKASREMGETEQEYEIRKREAASKNKSGVSNVKRKMPESEGDYYKRLVVEYSNPSMFHREDIIISKSMIAETIKEIGDLVKSFITSYKNDVFYKNTSYCYKWNFPCIFHSICKSSENQNIIDDFYTQKTREGLNLLTIPDDEEVL